MVPAVDLLLRSQEVEQISWQRRVDLWCFASTCGQARPAFASVPEMLRRARELAIIEVDPILRTRSGTIIFMPTCSVGLPG
ncbi:MAG TPA: hypothetical protein VMK12_06695, partial [Anaeromyxobacteraceae bacterium]|nr:hypothetical protein [Anaeromyxobacteraceae bacterium]